MTIRIWQITMLFCFLCVSVGAQTQIGQTIYGTNAFDLSGTNLAISGDGNTVAIGSRTNSDAGNQAGQVRIFRNNNGTWQQLGGDLNGDNAGDRFGGLFLFEYTQVALTADGETVVISAPEGNNDSGYIKVFDWNGSAWVQALTTIVASDAFLGYDVAVSDDGHTIVAGSFIGGTATGVYTYTRGTNSWVVDTIAPNMVLPIDVDLSADGLRLVLSIVDEGSPPYLDSEIKTYNRVAGEWVQEGAPLTGPSSIIFNILTQLSGDGQFMLVSASDQSVRVYQRMGTDWVEQQTDIVSNTTFQPAISFDGTTIATRNIAPQGSSTIAVELCQFNGVKWELNPNPIIGDPNTAFGLFLSLSDDGNTIAISSFSEDNGVEEQSGATRVYDLTLILPVELLDFSVQALPKEVSLTWKTVIESENRGFTVQHKSDSGNWQTLGFVAGAGESQEINDYHFVHRQPFSGTNYYRLKQEDINGTFQFSEILQVNFEKRDYQPLVFPNPTTSGEVTLSIPETFSEVVTIKLYDGVGKLIRTESVSFREVSLDGLTRGKYLVEVTNGQKVWRDWIVVL